MKLDELIQSIMTAKEEMLKYNIEANSVILNGRKYGKLIENLPPNIKPTICGMAVKADYALPDDFNFLVQREPPQPITNADRIRAMTDEELAIFLYNGWKEQDTFSKEVCERCVDTDISCQPNCWLNWLKQEAE